MSSTTTQTATTTATTKPRRYYCDRATWNTFPDWMRNAIRKSQSGSLRVDRKLVEQNIARMRPTSASA